MTERWPFKCAVLAYAAEINQFRHVRSKNKAGTLSRCFDENDGGEDDDVQ